MAQNLQQRESALNAIWKTTLPIKKNALLVWVVVGVNADTNFLVLNLEDESYNTSRLRREH